MAVTVSGTTVTFNDASTQTTAPVNTSANVNSITAGSGISVSASTGAVTISATGGGTVTSVATGNGLTGGTITSTGTISLDYYTGSTSTNTSYPIGTYLISGYGSAGGRNGSVTVFGYTAGITNSDSMFGNQAVGTRFTVSGTWRSRGAAAQGACCGATGNLIQRTA